MSWMCTCQERQDPRLNIAKLATPGMHLPDISNTIYFLNRSHSQVYGQQEEDACSVNIILGVVSSQKLYRASGKPKEQEHRTTCLISIPLAGEPP